MSDVATDETLETNILPDLPMEEEIPPPAEGAPEQPPASPPAATDELRSAMAELAGTVRQIAKPKEETPPPTPEQVAEFWQVYNPESSDKEFFRKFFRLN